MRKSFPCVLATNKECFFVCFLVSKVVHFLAKVVIIVPYCYFATCILERSLMYKRALSQKIWGKQAFQIFYTTVESWNCFLTMRICRKLSRQILGFVLLCFFLFCLFVFLFFICFCFFFLFWRKLKLRHYYIDITKPTWKAKTVN